MRISLFNEKTKQHHSPSYAVHTNVINTNISNSLFQHYVLVFGIAHVPEDKFDGIGDAAEALSETLEFLRMELVLGVETS